MIIVSDELTLSNLLIQYTYVNPQEEVEFGEINNEKELAILLKQGGQFVVTIWNYDNEFFNLDPDNPINIIEGQDYISIAESSSTSIPADSSISFLIIMNALPYYRSRGVIEIISENQDDDDFEIGLWIDGYISGGGSGGGSS